MPASLYETGDAMIIERVCDMFFGFFFGWLSSIPLLQWDIHFSMLEPFFSFLDFVAYFLPMNTVVMILAFIIVEENIKIAISMLKLIWRFIPIIGN